MPPLEDLQRWKQAELKANEDRWERRSHYGALETSLEVVPSPYKAIQEGGLGVDPQEHVNEAYRAFWRLSALKDNYDSRFTDSDRNEYFRLLFVLFP